jgi:hypothetical protein
MLGLALYGVLTVGYAIATFVHDEFRKYLCILIQVKEFLRL